jgi:hypothetical protein
MSRRWLVAFAALALAGGACQNATDLKTGDCFNGGSGESVTTVTPVDCAQAHEKEVFATLTHPGAGGPYPGDAVLEEYADRVCLDGFQPYVGRPYDSSELYISYLTPSPGSWEEGDHLVSCILHLENDAPITGSMQGSGR